MNEIELTTAEQMIAANVGIMRQVTNLRDGRQGAHNTPPELDWQRHVEGALAECAFAKWADRYWSGAMIFRAPDVGEIEVRGTHHKGGRLPLHERDKADDAFVLVIGLNGKYRIVGWIRGKDGKQDQHWNTKEMARSPCWAVEQRFLQDPAILRRDEPKPGGDDYPPNEDDSGT